MDLSKRRMNEWDDIILQTRAKELKEIIKIANFELMAIDRELTKRDQVKEAPIAIRMPRKYETTVSL